ncbi:UDP-N-acetylmuramoyl-tripeptide--D-alanyl-D-alanine ligase [Gillisia mitskevichiae]|uniref:UDP-N-acetylmuramoyl-tripeptide--D-alanyl-D-alanine ligase n=1 Tax=Gillisia mitskevichiae TaxID=270921 RepID=A0A495P4K7_9FLAO|nr:UDP-N-acetylmuramoyl-tripeptide--D-alanyl-D-alanine ligase [Gillisia mitskevichiae]RKS44906.1 UDP-N-acetylmuramoyl-tripeptide--D-alanyl-D-alanine ligase [Gillisia mitskevichiae]
MNIETLHKLFLKSKGVATDTRAIKSEHLFFALKGDNFNGNLFAEKALSKGASYAIIDEDILPNNDRCILVENVLDTLQQLSSYHRTFLNIPILAITGSNGKTTSKELIYAVLKKKFETIATIGNLNNHIGVPLTLLSMNSKTEFGIVEMGANHPKEIEKLCEIAKPNYGYITNFGKAHLEGFGSIEGVILAKSELYNYLKLNRGKIFLNIDDPIQQKQSSYNDVFTFGESTEADIIIKYDNSNTLAEVEYQNSIIKSQLTGTYNAINIAASVSIGLYFKISLESIQKAVYNYIPKNNRSQILKCGSNSLLMDAYNANPTSMIAALESFKDNPAKNKIVILGDMFELGTSSEEEHQIIVNYIETLELSKAFIVGKNFYRTKSKNEHIKKFENFSDLQIALESNKIQNSYILIKGSRGMALERVVDILKSTTR